MPLCLYHGGTQSEDTGTQTGADSADLQSETIVPVDPMIEACELAICEPYYYMHVCNYYALPKLQ